MNTLGHGCIRIDLEHALGPIKAMNAVNNGPSKARSDQTVSNFDEFAALEIPYARLHDSAHCHSYGGWHSVDITGVFPDFEADAEKPENYDFTLTDEYLENIRLAGTEPFYRLGQSIEHWIKKYGVNPPRDFHKWAVVCEHVIRHYNEGWADGFHWNIQYWEIWNEPDNQPAADGRPSSTWTGTVSQFCEFFTEVALYLKRCFPKLKIGGPSLGWDLEYGERILKHCRENAVQLDFFSWHYYCSTVEALVAKADAVHELMARYGYGNAESILNEYNYVRGWSDEWPYSLDCESGSRNYKGAAFVAAAMSALQRTSLDMLMFYDARVGCGMNNMFHLTSLEPLRGYYPFLAWSRLRRLGAEVAVGITDLPDIYATAAIGKDGSVGVLVTRYTDNDDITAPKPVTLQIPEALRGKTPVCHLTDCLRIYTQVFPKVSADGTLTLRMQPNSFVYIEF
ncbi:MAG: hypothetical protein IKO65_04045 [Victivallales bacterium]|nr:hypothetical protein [Victivallales bacterium]